MHTPLVDCIPINLTPSKIDENDTQNFIPQTTPTIILQPENVNFFSENDDSDSDKSKNELEIVENIRKNRSKKRKRKSIPNSSDEETSIGQQQNKTPKKYFAGIGGNNVKEVETKSNENCINDNEDDTTVKLTRSKAQALNKKVFNLTPLNGPKTTPEVAVLIREELKSDDEDEEYEPCYDEHSDDEHNTTTSDIDSQPRTPSSSFIVNDEKTTPKYTSDGLFKIPRDRLDSSSSQSEFDYNIAKRTRSKVSLTTIPIETIESTFNPPDIPADMLDFETDIDPDNNWVEFLNVLTKPLNIADNTCDEVDDDGDPEYDVAADKIPIDAEELRDVNISKKELNDLVEELLKSLDSVDFDEYESILDIPKPTPNRQRKSRGDITRTPNPQKVGGIVNVASTSKQAELNEFQPISPMALSRVMPQPLYTSSPITPSPYVNNSTSTQCSSTPFSNPQIQLTQNSNTVNASPPLNIVIPVNQLNPYQGAIMQNGLIQLPQFQQIIVNIPTIDILQNQQQLAINNGGTGTSNETPINNVANITETNKEVEPPVIEIDSQRNDEPPALKTTSTKISAKTLKTKSTTNCYGPTKFQKRLYKHLSHDSPSTQSTKNCMTSEKTTNGFTAHQLKLFDQQMRIHLQFATQTFMQTFKHPLLEKYSKEFKRFLIEIDETVNKMPDICANERFHNLRAAIELTQKWETELSEDNTENLEYFNFLRNECEQIKALPQRRYSYVMRFHERFSRAICHSDACMYANLLPKIPFKDAIRDKCKLFDPVEDYLIAFQLEQFYDLLNMEQNQLKPADRRRVTILGVCIKISKYFGYYQYKARALFGHIRDRKNPNINLMNPIQYYFKHRRAPSFKHELKSIEIKKPINQSPGNLPYIWAKYVDRFRAIEHDKLINGSNSYFANRSIAAPTVAVAPQPRPNVCRNLSEILDNQSGPSAELIQQNNSAESVASSSSGSNTEPIQIHIEYVDSNNQQIQSTSSSSHENINRNDNDSPSRRISISYPNITIPSDYQSVEKGFDPNAPNIKCLSPLSICSYDSYYEQHQLQDYHQATNLSHHSNNSQCMCTCKCSDSTNNKSINNLSALNCSENTERGQTLLTSYFAVTNKNPKQFIAKKFAAIIYQFTIKLYENINCDDSFVNYPKLLAVNNCCKVLYIYLRIVHVKYTNLSTMATKRTKPLSQQPTSVSTVADSDCATIVAKKSKPTIIDSATNSHCISGSSSAYTSDSTGTTVPMVEIKRGQKGYKTVDNTRLMMLPESREETNEKDLIFSQNFMYRVEETYHAEDQDKKYDEFEDILRNFNPLTESVPDLYYKMENLFLPDHPELIEIFLTFLLPCHAAQVGKFMEHFMLTNTTTFINKLNIFFSKQPAQIRKIHACLKDLTMEPDLKMEQIKIKILPLLKGNSLLIEWFLQCFPSEQYPDSPADEYEYLNLRKAIEILDDPDVYEELPQNQILPDPVDNPCHLRYLNGRIYYGSRIQLPGKLSFMDSDKANNAKSTSTNSVIETDTVTTNDDGTLPRYRCMHSIREYGNLKIKEHQRTHMDTETNSIASGEEHDANDDEDSAAKRMQQTQNNIANDSLNNSSGSEASDCCDDITLKAHAIRLNPTAHGSASGLNAEDTQNLLKLVVGTERLSDADREALNKSPKKITKLLRKSPKKSSTNKSPINKKSTVLMMPSASSSAAVQTAKKLKKLIETPTTNSSSDDENKKLIMKVPRVKKKKDASVGSGRQTKLPPAAVNALKSDKVDKSAEVEVVSETVENDVETIQEIDCVDGSTVDESNCDENILSSTVEQSQMVWSRDEDKMVLEQIKQGFSTENELIKVLESQLIGRTYQEILDRFKFLMDVIAQLREVS